MMGVASRLKKNWKSVILTVGIIVLLVLNLKAYEFDVLVMVNVVATLEETVDCTTWPKGEEACEQHFETLWEGTSQLPRGMLYFCLLIIALFLYIWHLESRIDKLSEEGKGK